MWYLVTSGNIQQISYIPQLIQISYIPQTEQHFALWAHAAPSGECVCVCVCEDV